MAIGKANKVAKWVEPEGTEGKFIPVDVINFSMTCDHRIIDGATCARFSERVRELVEDPHKMLISMN